MFEQLFFFLKLTKTENRSTSHSYADLRAINVSQTAEMKVNQIRGRYNFGRSKIHFGMDRWRSVVMRQGLR